MMKLRVAAVGFAAMSACALLGCSDCNDDGELDDLECILGPSDPDPDREPFDLTVAIEALPAWAARKCVFEADAPDTERERSTQTLGYSGFIYLYARDYLHSDKTYTVDVWIDADGDDRCDPPPEDAAWHFELPNPPGPRTIRIDATTPMTPTCP